MTASFARLSAPTALQVWSWEASSKTTRSNCPDPGSRYCATESGLMSRHGHSENTTSPHSEKTERTVTLRPRLLSALCSRTACGDAPSAPDRSGVREATS